MGLLLLFFPVLDVDCGIVSVDTGNKKKYIPIFFFCSAHQQGLVFFFPCLLFFFLTFPKNVFPHQ